MQTLNKKREREKEKIFYEVMIMVKIKLMGNGWCQCWQCWQWRWWLIEAQLTIITMQNGHIKMIMDLNVAPLMLFCAGLIGIIAWLAIPIQSNPFFLTIKLQPANNNHRKFQLPFQINLPFIHSITFNK